LNLNCKKSFQLVGSDALPTDQQLTLEVARMIREFFLQQNGFHDVDAYCDIHLQYRMAKAILSFQDAAKSAMASGAQLADVVNVPSRSDLMRGRFEKGIRRRHRIDGRDNDHGNRRYGGGQLRRGIS
jgi:vacuolar-type H+-ATPase catalytic subunit A/Vma1